MDINCEKKLIITINNTLLTIKQISDQFIFYNKKITIYENDKKY